MEKLVIYCITNLVTNKVYIGKSVSGLSSRWRKHKSQAKLGSTSYLHRSIVKHGIDKFKIEIVDIANNKEELISLEKYYIFLANSTNRLVGYNLTKGGEGGNGGTTKGRKHSPETIAKMTAFQRSRTPHPNSMKAIKICGSRNKGMKLSESQKSILRKVHSKPVMDDLGNKFSSQTEAAKFYGIAKTNICEVLKGKKSHTKGRKFFYV